MRRSNARPEAVEAKKRWRASHPETVKESQRRYAAKQRMKRPPRVRMTEEERKQAQKDAQTRYRKKHAAELRAKARARALTPEQRAKRLAYKRAWNAAHPEYMERYRTENHEQLITQGRRHYAANRADRRADAKQRAALRDAASKYLRSIGLISPGDADRTRRAALAYAREHGLLPDV